MIKFVLDCERLHYKDTNYRTCLRLHERANDLITMLDKLGRKKSPWIGNSSVSWMGCKNCKQGAAIWAKFRRCGRCHKFKDIGLYKGAGVVCGPCKSKIGAANRRRAVNAH